YINDILLQPDGKIVATGADYYNYIYMLATRYLPDGSVDESCGDGGFVKVKFGDGSEAKSVLLQQDGKIILSGYSNNLSSFAMVRLNANGIVDSSFGENGLVVTDIASNDKSTASVLQQDGKIILGGTDYSTNF